MEKITRRKDGRAVKKIIINGKAKFFYSNKKSDREALKDINQQMIDYEKKSDYVMHNFKDLAEQMLAEKELTISNSTYNGYLYAVKHLEVFYNSNIEDITPVDIQNLLDEMEKKNFSFSAISKTKTVFGLVLKQGIKNGVKVVNFMNTIKIPKNSKKGKVVSPDDEVIQKILNHADEEFGMWAMCLLCTGWRRGELAALQKGNIDFENNLIHLRNSVEYTSNQPRLKNKPKTESSVRDTPLLDILKPRLLEYTKDLKKTDFVFGKEKPLTLSAIRRRWEKYCKNIGCDFNGHQLRHAYAKLLYRAGIDPKTAQHLLGHADFKTTMNIYTDFSEDVTKKSVQKLNSFMNQEKEKSSKKVVKAVKIRKK